MNNWLTDELKQEVKKVFEPKYKRVLSEDEIVSIASNLESYIEHYAIFAWKIKNEQSGIQN